jgi:hypothetical protein
MPEAGVLWSTPPLTLPVVVMVRSPEPRFVALIPWSSPAIVDAKASVKPRPAPAAVTDRSKASPVVVMMPKPVVVVTTNGAPSGAGLRLWVVVVDPEQVYVPAGPDGAQSA